MKIKKLNKLTIFLGGSVLALGLAISPAHALILVNPGNADGTLPGGPPGNNCEPTCVETQLGLPAGSLTDLLYKTDVGGGNSGSFSDDYITSFTSTTGVSGFTIEHVGPDTIVCPSCYLAVKDGVTDPRYYFYDISSWDGVMDIVGSGFWPDGGAISHVSIWGGPDPTGGGGPQGTIPEPATVLLFGTGLAGLGLWRWSQKK